MLRTCAEDVENLRVSHRVCDHTEKNIKCIHRASDFSKRHNGNDFKDMGGSRTEWFRCVVNKCVREHYPELQSTILKEFFKSLD